MENFFRPPDHFFPTFRRQFGILTECLSFSQTGDIRALSFSEEAYGFGAVGKRSVD
jgi:hypothetical protein